MAVNTTTPSFDKATRLLIDGRLHQACSFLSVIHHLLPAAQPISDEANLLSANYERLLDHYTQNGADPKRAELFDDFFCKVWKLCDKLYDLESPMTEPQTAEDIPALVDALLADAGNDQLLGQVFEQVVERRHLSRSDRNALNLAILDEPLPEYAKATLLSAITLHLIDWFDAELAESLYVYTFEDQPVQLQMQAWVTLVLVALIHKDRIAHQPRLKEQYRMMCEAEPALLFDIQTTLLQCCDADIADKKMHEIASKVDENDDEQAVSANVKEFIKFVTDGIDLSYKAFAQQSKLAFFSHEGNRHHWLQPFSLEQPTIKAIYEANPKGQSWIRMLMQSVAQCETDKYAALLLMQHMGGAKLMNAIGEKLEQTGLKFEDVSALPPVYVMRNYLHDLYRYCTLHPKAMKMRHCPFFFDLKLCMNPCFGTDIFQLEQLEKIGELLINAEHWAEAAQVYELSVNHELSEARLQRLAYTLYKSHEDTANQGAALRQLRRCNLLYPGNQWTLRRLSDILHDDFKDYVSESIILHEAIDRYLPDDVSLLMRLGRCLNSQHRYREALEPLFKADLIKEGRRHTQRELALALFATHDYERAEQYIDKATSHSTASAEDYLVSGHIALHNGDTQRAKAQYMLAEEEYAVNCLRKDRELLIQAGVDDLDIDLMCELLIRELKYK